MESVLREGVDLFIVDVCVCVRFDINLNIFINKKCLLILMHGENLCCNMIHK